MAKKKKKTGLPSKYAKMGFKKGWREYKKTAAYKAQKKASTKKATKKTRKSTKRKTRKSTKTRKTTKKRRTRRVSTAGYGLTAMAARGASKLRAKGSQMKSNYNASKGRMMSNYGSLPFGPKTKAAYRAGVKRAKYRSPNAKKWERNWKAGVKR